MIKAKRGNTVVIGLSDRNIKLLKEGKPIKFNLKELGMQDIEILIFNGTDEQSMFKMMSDSIHPTNTIIKSDRSNDN